MKLHGKQKKKFRRYYRQIEADKSLKFSCSIEEAANRITQASENNEIKAINKQVNKIKKWDESKYISHLASRKSESLVSGWNI